MKKTSFILQAGRKNVIITKTARNVFPEELEYRLSRIPYIAESMVWGSEGEDGSNDTSIIATVTLSEEDVAEKLGVDYTEEQARDLVWEEVDKVNEELPYYKKIKQIRIRKEDFEKTTGKKIKRFVDANKEETL